MKNPLVSIIITAYNAQRWIEKSVETLQKQTYTNIEIIIVDDCSFDNTPNVLVKLSEKDDRIKVWKTEKNSGTYVAKNLAIEKSSGDFITFQDADDWAAPTRIEKQLEAILKTPQAHASSCLFVRVNDSGKYLSKPSYCFIGLMLPRYIFHKLGYFDTVKFGADSEFLERYLKFYGQPFIVKETLYYALQHNEGLTSRYTFNQPERPTYMKYYQQWHKVIGPDKMYMDFPQTQRPFPAHPNMLTTATKLLNI